MDPIMWLALGGLILLYTLQSLLTKLYTDKYPGDGDVASSVLTVVSGVVVVVVTFFFFSGMQFTFNVWSLFIGAANAAALFLYNFFLVKSSQKGPYSVIMMFNLSGGIIIPVIAALIMGWDTSWGTPFRIILNLASISSIILAVYLASKKDGAEEKKITPSFILSCFGLAIANGTYGIMLTLQQQTAAAGGEANRDEMIIATFFFAAVISVVVGLVKQGGGFLRSIANQNKLSLIYLIGTSIVFALAVNVIVILIPHFDTTILYTLDNASVLIMSALCSCIFFGEKLSPKNIIGISVMVAALVSMNLLPSLFPHL